MSVLEQAAGSPALQIVGWTVLHSLWQVGVVAAVLAVLLRLARGAAPSVRYGLACSALVAAFAMPVATAGWMQRSWAEHAACWRLAASLPAAEVPLHCHDHGLVAHEEMVAAVGPAGTEGAIAAEPTGAAGHAAPVDHAIPAKHAMAAGHAIPPEHTGAAGHTVPADHAMPVGHTAPADQAASAGQAISLALTRPVGLLGLAWLLGAAIAVGCLGAGWLRVRRIRARARPPGTRSADRLAALARRMGVRAAVALRCTEQVDVPTVVGCRRPVVLLPAGTDAALSPTAFDTVLAHELAHVRRHDFVVNLVQCGIEALLFHHPAVRWIARRIREEREFRCDDEAVAATPHARAEFLRALVALDGSRLRPAAAYSPALTGGALLARARRIARGTPRRTTLARIVLAVAIGSAPLWVPLLQVDPAARVSVWAVMTLDIDERR